MIELNEAYTLITGNHTLTIGSHNEFLALRNLFIRDNIGTTASPAWRTSRPASRSRTISATR